MEYSYIKVETGEISVLTLARSEKRNALSVEMMDEIIDALDRLDAMDDVKTIIIKGEGKGFCAGADLSMMGADMPEAEKKQLTARIPGLLKKLPQVGKIIISEVHGFAVAGGLGFAMTCDLCVCAEDAKLGMPEVKRDLMPMNILAPLSRVMPPRTLFEMVFSGENITGRKAFELGMVNQAVPAEELDAATMELARKVSIGDPAVIRLGKEAYYRVRDMEYGSSFEYLNDMLHKTMRAGASGEKCGDFIKGGR